MTTSKLTHRVPTVEVFYDGDCPLCRREIDMLRRWDKKSRILFTNIAAEGFDPAPLQRTHDQLMAQIHGRNASGELIVGVEVFRQLYQAVGLGWLVWVTRLPVIRQILDVFYRLFARYRLRLTGRCDAGRCSVPPASPSVPSR
ncbi:DUF393 domain-containing protein [bacterium]|nr:DUF393 domain-containing protein [bacterium]